MDTNAHQEAADAAAYEVDYTNEYGNFSLSGEFSRVQAAQMVATLFRLEAWGKVSNATVRRTDKPLDTRPLSELNHPC